MKPIIELKNIKYSYDKKRHVLNDVSLIINEGEDIAIIGPNGSGKSTLAKIILYLLKPKEGNVIFNNEIITDKNVDLIRNQTGIVFQNPDNQFIGATVKDDIAFGLENKNTPYKEMDKLVKEYASKLGILHLLNKEPDMLSGGQKQRVAIAGILAMNIDIVVFDEALAMLDPSGKNSIKELIKEIKINNPKMSVIRITHDLDEAFEADRVIVLSNGEIRFNDTPINVFSHEKELLELGLDVPFIFKLNRELIKEGLIDKEEYSLDKLIDKLCR